MKLLITGSNGFLGSYICKSLRDKKIDIIESSKDIDDKKKFFLNLGQNIKTNRNLIILKKIDVIIHCAFNFNCNNYEEHLKININGCRDLFDLAQKNNIKIIYISSISSFAKARSLYGKIKYQIEELAKKNNAIIVRPGLIYSKNSKGIFGTIEKLINVFPIVPLINFGNQGIFTCKIEVLSKLIEKLIMMKNKKYILITAASENKISFKSMIKIIAKKRNKKIILIPFPSIVIYFLLHINSMVKIIKNIKKDNLTSILNNNNKPDFKELNKLQIKFPEFKNDYK